MLALAIEFSRSWHERARTPVGSRAEVRVRARTLRTEQCARSRSPRAGLAFHSLPEEGVLAEVDPRIARSNSQWIDWSSGCVPLGRPLPRRVAHAIRRCQMLLRKEVIQPHLPVRLPCYDFTPIADPTFDGSLHKGWATGFGCYRLSWCDGRCVQGPGTYSPRHC